MHETLTLQVVLATATSVHTLMSSVHDGVFGNELSSQELPDSGRLHTWMLSWEMQTRMASKEKLHTMINQSYSQ